MFAEERRQKILELLERDQVVKVPDLSAYFNVSEATIRRDLQELEEAGYLKRTHGGAISNQAATFEPSLAEKEDQYQAEKIAIAEIAVQLVQEGDTVMLDAGSTTLQIARRLKHRKNITIVTNAVNIACELAAGNTEVILLGGNLRQRTLSLVGPITENILSGLYVDKLFLATNGVDLKKGLTTPNLAEAQTKRAMLNSAGEVILVADHSKFGRVSFSHICNLDRIDCLITDNGAPDAFLATLKKQGLRVLVAGGGECKE
ncbi:DeoR/GlpR family DNA-binding transcription regulator [Desulfofundulus sp.]|uniref:DeoR/GlpR family DNA-binding transcription regulator n=1 Tax=Desulfofundulus sp. TaxID=2282750 RepID=UPI003C750287